MFVLSKEYFFVPKIIVKSELLQLIYILTYHNNELNSNFSKIWLSVKSIWPLTLIVCFF